MSLSPISLLRNELKKHNIDGIIVPKTDPYMSEYLASSEERVAWLTGFKGSNALAIVLPKSACVFSDGRYSIQIVEQALAGWDTAIMPNESPADYLKKNAKKLRIGFIPTLTNQAMLRNWSKSGVELVPLTSNPVDDVWKDRPSAPTSKVIPHLFDYSGETSLSKRKKISQAISKSNADALLVTDCHSLMWLLNIRGSDVAYTPLSFGYGIFYKDNKAKIFIDPKRLNDLPEDGDITFLHPEQFEETIADLNSSKVLLDPSSPLSLNNLLTQAGAEVIYEQDPSLILKACKNTVEISGQCKAQLIDNQALCSFLASLENLDGTETEVSLADRLLKLRKKNKSSFVTNSFETISASNANAALPHYTPNSDTPYPVTEGVYLIDSGGQYKSGTTDLTRTVWIGPKNPPAKVKKIFTHVLKGMIAISTARFPQGTPGYLLDSLARAPIWSIGGDYEHGTGHGVGSFLSVHEGPQSISPRFNPTALQEGMILSNEPGFYQNGQFGIRIENLILVQKSPVNLGKGKFLEFETLSYVPIDRKLIDTSYLNPEEIDWIDAYHYETLLRHEKFLAPDEQDWLRRSCKPLGASY